MGVPLNPFLLFTFLWILQAGDVHAEGLYSLIAPLGAGSVSMLGARPAAEGEALEALHVVGHRGDIKKTSNLFSKCSAVSFGRCIITAGHCDMSGSVQLTVRGSEGFEAKVDRSQTRTLAKGDDMGSDDLSVMRLDQVPPKYLTPDDLAMESDITFPETPEVLSKEDFASIGLPGIVVSFGHDYYSKPVEALEKRSTEGSLGAQFRRDLAVANPQKQVGGVRVLGRLGEVIYRKELNAFREHKQKIDQANWIVRVRNYEAIKEFTEFYDLALGVASELGTLVVSPDDARLQGGDSGGPLFYHSQRGRVLLGIASKTSKDDVDLATVKDIPNWVALIEGRAGFCSSVIEQRDWLIQSWKELGCDPGSLGTDAMAR